MLYLNCIKHTSTVDGVTKDVNETEGKEEMWRDYYRLHGP